MLRSAPTFVLLVAAAAAWGSAARGSQALGTVGAGSVGAGSVSAGSAALAPAAPPGGEGVPAQVDEPEREPARVQEAAVPGVVRDPRRLPQVPLLGGAAVREAGFRPIELVQESDGDGAPTEFDPRERLRALGAPVPPGLSAARSKERRTARAARLETLATELGDGGHPSLVQLLDGVLSDPFAPDDLWEAAAATAGDLVATHLAPRLAEALDGAAPGSRRAAAARRGLYAMYGLWITGSAEVAPLAGLVDGPALDAYRSQVLALEERYLSQSTRLWGYQPDAALPALSDPSPRVRAAAARALASAAGAGRLESDAVTDALLSAAQVEGDGHALCAQLEALAPSLQARAPLDERVARARELLASGVTVAPPSVQHGLARLLAGLPWERESTDAPSSAAAGYALARTSLARAAQATPLDPDVVIGVLQSLRSLGHTYGLRDGLPGASPSAPIFALYDRPDASREVRVAAAAALADLAEPSDLEALVERLAAEADPSLRFALLGAVAAFAGELAPDAPGVARLLALLPELAAAEGEELRLRALGVLDALTDGEPRAAFADLDASFLVPRWTAETSAATKDLVERLIKRLGGPQDLRRMLELDVFATAAARSPRQAAGMAQALGASDRDLRLRSARVLASIEDPARLESALVQAIELGVGPDPTESVATAPTVGPVDPGAGATAEPTFDGSAEESAEFVRWALALRRITGTLGTRGRANGPDGSPPRPVLRPAVLDRLLELHCAKAALDGAERARAVALFSFDAGRPTAVVEAAFDAARAALPQDTAPAPRWTLERERARFLASVDRPADALAATRAILAEDPATAAAWLGTAGLREHLGYLERVAAGANGGGAVSLVRERAQAVTALVALPSWGELPTARRAQDALDLVESAQAARDYDLASRALDLFASTGLPLDGSDPLWAEVPEASALLERLVEAHAGLVAFAEANRPLAPDGAADGAADRGAPANEPPVGG